MDSTASSSGAGPESPSPAQVYHYLLGGKRSLAPSRAIAAALLQADPGLQRRCRLNRAVLTAAVSRAAVADDGVAQFVDLGCGLPAPMMQLHEAARFANPASRFAYVDVDGVAVSQMAPFHDPGRVAVTRADLTQPAGVLEDPMLRSAVDVAAPVGLILGAVAQLFPAAEFGGIVQDYVGLVAPGSWIILSCPNYEDPDLLARVAGVCAAGEFHNHGIEEMAKFLAGLELIDPGISPAGAWLQGGHQYPQHYPASGTVLCAVGRKP